MLDMLKSFIIRSLLIIKNIAYYYKLKFQYRNEINKKTKNKSKKLKKQEITEIKKYYSKYGYDNVKTSWHDFYYSSNNMYSVEYVPEDIFHATISKKLNQMRQWPALLDKNLLGIIFKDYKQPEIVLKNVNGFYFIDDEIFIEDAAIERVINESHQMVIKPSLDSGNGQNVVSFLIHNNKTNYNNLSVKELFNKYKKDFIVQKVVNQNEISKSLNPSSLNTLRVLSYLNHTGVHILSTIMRIGKKGVFTDNFESGGIGCGVDNNGMLKEYGYFENGTRTTKTDNGVLLKDFKVPSYNIILKQIEEMHLLIPYFRLISWDIGIDHSGMPLLIEYNTYHQGVTVHQLANGPLFGPFVDEILTQGKINS